MQELEELFARLGEPVSPSTRPSEDDNLPASQEVSLAEMICLRNKEVERTRLDEGLEVQELMRLMPKSVQLGEEWFVYSMVWLRKWEDYVYFDLIDSTKPSSGSSDSRAHPGPVDCSDIILPDSKH